MKTSQRGISLIQQFEGLRQTAYQDDNGVWTIGYGHTGPEVVPGLKWTAAQCDMGLAADLTTAEMGVEAACKGLTLNQNQFDALVSFSYNEGVGALRKSDLLKKLKAGDLAGATAGFLGWTRVGTDKYELLGRRKKEAKLFSEAV